MWVALSAEMDPLDFHSPLYQPLSLAGKPLAANQEANHHVGFRGRINRICKHGSLQTLENQTECNMVPERHPRPTPSVSAMGL